MLNEAVCNLLRGYITIAERDGNDKFVKYAEETIRMVSEDDTYSALSGDYGTPVSFRILNARLYDLSRFLHKIIG